MPFYLATKEMLRNKFRFLAIIVIVALVTLLVIFLAALGDGLAEGAKEYIETIDAELIVFQEDIDLVIPASSLGIAKLNDLRRLDGVEAAGPVGFSSAAIMLNRDGETERLDVSLTGVAPGMPGAPTVFSGSELDDERAQEVVIDQHVLDRANIPVGSIMIIKTTQSAEEQFYELTVVGHTASQEIQFSPQHLCPDSDLESDKATRATRWRGRTDLQYDCGQVSKSRNTDRYGPDDHRDRAQG